MKQGIHNFSEIGKLNKVLLHRLGDEVEGLFPTILRDCCLTIYHISRWRSRNMTDLHSCSGITA